MLCLSLSPVGPRTAQHPLTHRGPGEEEEEKEALLGELLLLQQLIFPAPELGRCVLLDATLQIYCLLNWTLVIWGLLVFELKKICGFLFFFFFVLWGWLPVS